jgi:hypothetical protein
MARSGGEQETGNPLSQRLQRINRKPETGNRKQETGNRKLDASEKTLMLINRLTIHLVNGLTSS